MKGEWNRAPAETMPRHGHARRPQHVLHPRLLAEVLRGLLGHPLDAEAVAHVPERHLQLLEHADQAVHATQVLGERSGCIGDLLRVGGVVDAIVTGEAGAHGLGEALFGILADQPQTDIRQRRRRGDEAHRGLEKEGSDEDGGRHRGQCRRRGRAEPSPPPGTITP